VRTRPSDVGPIKAAAAFVLATFLAAAFLATATLSAQPAAAIAGAGYSAPIPVKIAPGQILTFFVSGIGAGLTTKVSANGFPLPSTLAEISVTLNELSQPPLAAETVPLLAVSPLTSCDGIIVTVPCTPLAAVTVQIPFGIRTMSAVSPIPPPATLTISENGGSSATISLSPMSDQPHVVTTCDVNVSSPAPGSPCVPVVTHGDGSLVTPDHPAHTGEELVLYAFGLGATLPGLAAGGASPAPAQPVIDTFILIEEAAIQSIPSERQTFAPLFAGLTPGFAGLYQVNFLAPAPPLPFASGDCATPGTPNGNVALTLRGDSADQAIFCVTP
jgi:uncharacterized protein (TIGR03437 family)